jgi:hypothetical protein
LARRVLKPRCMADVVFISVTVIFFAIAIAYAAACERL